MPHGIIFNKNAALIKKAADINLDLNEIHETLEAMPAGEKKESVEGLVAALSGDVDLFTGDFQSQIDEIKSELGL